MAEQQLESVVQRMIDAGESEENIAAVIRAGGGQPQESALARFFKPLLPSETLSDYWEGPKYALQHPLDSLGLLGGAIGRDPVGAVPVVGNVKRGIQDVREGNYAGAAGETAAGALSVLPFMRGKVNVGNAARSATGSVARGVAAAGRGLEWAGEQSKGITPLAAVEAIARQDPMGVAVGAAPYVAKGVGRGMQRLGNAVEGLTKKAGPEIDPHLPNTSGYDPTAPFGDAADHIPPMTDQHMPNVSGYDPTEVLSGGAEPVEPIVDRYMPNSSGYEPRDVAAGTPDPTWEGRISDWMGSRVEPASLEALGSSEPTGAGPRALPRRDDVWGPGSVDTKGNVAQAEVSRANLKYDPQTPTSYLREQLAVETDPATREFLAKAIDQRRRIEAATTGVRP